MALAVTLSIGPTPKLARQGAQRTPRRNVAPITIGVAAISAFVLLGGWVGLLSAVLIVIGVPRLLIEIQRREQMRSDAMVTRQVPHIADMLAAVLAAGVPIPHATQAVARATNQSALNAIVRAQQLGADPVDAWADAPRPLLPIGQALIRSQHTGAAASSLLHGVADDARRQQRTTVEIAARTAGVRAVAPLAACFLPAFLLLGVVPVVVTLAGDLFRW